MARRGGSGGIQLTITSVPILFAVLYGIMLLYYIRRAIQNPTQVFITLSLFCASELVNAPFGDDTRMTSCL